MLLWVNFTENLQYAYIELFEHSTWQYTDKCIKI